MNKFVLSAAKRICLALLACVLLTFSATAQTPAKWVFISVCKQEIIKPCGNPVNTDYRKEWIKFDATYEAQRKLVIEALKKDLGGTSFWVTPFFVPVGAEQYIALVKKQRKCPGDGETKYVPTYWFYQGKSRADIDAQMIKNGQDFPENVSQEIIQLFDCRKEIANF